MSVPDASVSSTRVFEPIQVGRMKLSHRIALAPLTRHRADDSDVPLPFCVDYYAQRASMPGTLLISEGTWPCPQAAGHKNVPGIWKPEQIREWRKIVDAVHTRGCYIFVQLWAMGRAAGQETADRHGVDVVSSSAVPLPTDQFYSGQGDRPIPRELTEPEIYKLIGEFAAAARTAVFEAGFDGVEIHAANGYLIDQFTQDACNKRADTWGGNIEKRARFAIEITKAVAEAIGSDRTSIRLSPWSTFQDMRMADPKPQFLFLVQQLKKLNLAYLHLIGPRVDGVFDNDRKAGKTGNDSNDFLIEAWGKESPLILGGGSKPTTVSSVVNEDYPGYQVLVAYGRYFISNPDLVYRIRKGLKFRPYEPMWFYARKERKGYADYSFSHEFLLEHPDVVQIFRARL